MTLEKLKELLESGAITQAEYDALAAGLQQGGDDKGGTGGGNSDDKNGEGGDGNPDETLTLENLERIVQSRVDKAMASAGKEKAELKKELDRLRKAKLTESELKQLEIEEKEKAILEKEKDITERENRLYAIKALKEAGLDDGSDTSLSIVDFVMGADTTEIDTKVKSFGELLKKLVSAEVDRRFKENGRNPNKGGTGGGEVNPYAKDTFNLTEQMKIELTNPDLAKRLKAEAGV